MKPLKLLSLTMAVLAMFFNCSPPGNQNIYEDQNEETPSQNTKDQNPSDTIICSQPYADAQAEVLAERVKFQTLYSEATDSKKKEILLQAGYYLDSAVCDILFPYWKGTKWDFNGHTNVPNEGEIACGYLVSTILKHSGVNINRYKMAQQSALSEIKTISGTSGANYLGNNSEKALEKIKQLKDGLYILGLSNHVGFIRVKNGDVRFIHSTYLEPTQAINEKADDSDAFTYSNAYYIGAISSNEVFIKKWLSGKVVRVVLD